eukprot:GHVU01149252.1.p2 GENE.GHVU01149252.1~~GHVU01149252.1.p2  ORF type:complete len:428 (-),score=59.77 GHVU01149252.1:4483-5766(-)
MDNLPLTFVDKPLTRKNTCLRPVCYNTFVKWMRLVCTAVEEEIAKVLSEKFGIILDGWTEDGTHYVGLFATTPKGQYCLSFSPLDEEDDLGAESHKEFLESVLEVYNRDLLAILFQVSDNAPVMVALAAALGVPLIGCYSHKLNLGMNRYFSEEGHLQLFEKVNTLMKALRTIKQRARLRSRGQHLVPKAATKKPRWSCNHDMVKRYLKIRGDIDFSDSDVVQHELTRHDTAVLESLSKRLDELNSVTVKLQDPAINMAEGRELVEHCVKLEPSMAFYLDQQADIVASPTFEAAVVKVLNRNEGQLDADEKKVLLPFKSTAATGNTTALTTEEEELPLATQVLLLRNRRIESDRAYQDLGWIPCTSNVCERAFSMSGKVLTDDRKGLSPHHLELIMFLKLNRQMWNLGLVQRVINSAKGKEVESRLD